MRTFASLIPANKPVSSPLALSAILLDRAGVDAEALLDGLTVIECPSIFEVDVGDAIDGLLFDDDASRGVAYGDKSAPAMILQGHIRAGEFQRALTRGIPVVVIGQADALPAEARVQADRWHRILPDMSDEVIARTIALVTRDGVSVGDVRGLAEKIGSEHLLSTARHGLSSAVVIERLREIARKVDDARADRAVKVLDDLQRKAAEAVPLGDAAADVVAKLSDLTGFGAAREWGLQLAADLRAYQDGLLPWEDVDKGVLLFGGPGTGKTFFAGALAAEAGVPLVRTSYSDWHTAGTGGDSVQKSLSKLFAEWRKKSANGPIIVFLDEIDSIGRRGRSDNSDYWYGPIINAWLAFLDGSEPRVGIVAIAATNRPEIVDPALLRPGRFETLIEIPRPGIDEIGGMIAHHAPIPAEDLQEAAVACRGRSPAQIAALCRVARRLARKAKCPVAGADVVAAAETLRPRRSAALDRGAAFHEAAHAVAALSLGIDLHWVDLDESANKIRLPEGVLTGDDVQRVITMLLAGRRADAMLGGAVDSGASDDLAKATHMARDAIERWGLTGRLHVLAPDDGAKLRDVRDAVSELLDACDLRAAKLVDAHREPIVRVAEALLSRRYLDGAEVLDLMEADRAPRT